MDKQSVKLKKDIFENTKEKKINSEYFHIYDQGLFSLLSRNCSGRYIEKINQKFSINLVDDGFRLVDTPFSFLEAVGVTRFKGVKEKIEKELCKKLKLWQPKIKKEAHFLMNNLPDLAFDLCYKYFLELEDLSPERLVCKAEDQLNWMEKEGRMNPVFIELTSYILREPSFILSEGSERSKEYHREICCHLALEYAQRINYFQLFSKIYPDVEKRKIATQEIYHAFFSLFFHCTKGGNNKSFFRASDEHIKNVFMSLKIDDSYKDIYLHKKDLLDPYLIHFGICGYHFQGNIYKTIVFTCEKPDKMRLRLKRALSVYHWIRKHKEGFLVFNSGKVCCIDELSLDIVEVIEVEKLSYQKINEEEC